MALPAAAAAAVSVVTNLGARFAASSVGKWLIGTPLRSLMTGLGIGQMVSQRAPQAQEQVQRHKA